MLTFLPPRLTADTLRALQQPRARRRQQQPSSFSRRLGEPAEERQGQEGLAVTLREMERALGLGSGRGRPGGTQVGDSSPVHGLFVVIAGEALGCPS